MSAIHPFKAPILIALGAVCGALSRHYIGWYFQQYEKIFPLSTFLVNISGCLIAGIFVGITAGATLPKLEDLRMFFVVGFLGSYTTFSAYALQTLLMSKDQHYLTSLVYWVATPIACLIAVFVGFFIGKAFKLL